MRRAEPLEALWSRVLGDGAVVVVGSGVGDGVPAGALRTIEAPPDETTLNAALRTVADGELDAALATEWGAQIEAPTVARALADKVRPAGVVALAAPLAGSGVRQRVLGLFQKRRPVELETLCEALLLARLVDIRAEEPGGRVGVAWARVPERG